MSVIVKNMELSAESCLACRFLVCDDFEEIFECTALEKFMDNDELPEGRRSDCPLGELIRCKDCKHRYTDCGMGFCEKLDSMFYHYEDQEPIDADFYCKWAEPKEEKDDR